MSSKDEAKKQYIDYIPDVKKVDKWYEKFNFVLVESMNDLRDIFNEQKSGSYFMAFDTETTGLDFEEADIVGYSFCLDGKTAYYVPVYHFNYKGNLGTESLDFIYERMKEARVVFMYNARYDMRIMEYHGYQERKEELDKKRWKFVRYDMSKINYFDVAVAVWLSDTNIKFPSLKGSSRKFLGIEQMHFDEVVESAGSFFYLDPSENEDTVFYAAADALCTYLLVPATIKYYKESKMAGKVDNKVLYPLMHYENEKLWLDGELIKKYEIEATAEVDRLEKEVYDMFGYQINLNSPIQVGQAFDRLGIDTGERTATGNMSVGIKVLDKLSEEVINKYPALKSYVRYKEMAKLLSSYILPFKKAYERDGFLRVAYKTSEVASGRFACGKDGKNSFFSKINVQSLPKAHVKMEDVFDLGQRDLFSKKDNIIMGYKFSYSNYDDNGNYIKPDDPTYIGQVEGMNDKLNLRMSITPKMYEDSEDEEFVYCSFDYSAEEIRITANISREPTWVNAFTHDQDIHESTAKAVWGEENYNRDYRKKAKFCNFGIIYGMSAKSFADNPIFGFKNIDEAEEFYEHFKSSLSTLFSWEDRVQERARRVGTVYTYFGRPRRLRSYYQTGKYGFANRSAVNTIVQGTAGDIMRIVMCKLWKRLFDNDEYRDDVAWRLGIHDEIGYTVRTSRLLEILDIIKETQTVKIKEWPVNIVTDPSIGWSMGRVYDFHRVEDDTELGYHYEPDLV